MHPRIYYFELENIHLEYGDNKLNVLLIQFQSEECDAIRDDCADMLRQFNGSGANVRAARVLQMLVGSFVCPNVHGRLNDMYVTHRHGPLRMRVQEY